MRENPDARIQKPRDDVRMNLHSMLPATAAELIKSTGRSHESVYGELVSLEARGQALVEVVHAGKQIVACEWHKGHCDPAALCLASRDGFCDHQPLNRPLGTGER